jgi:hypothetical protein
MQIKAFREPTYHEIAERAYLLWQSRGALLGYDKEDWFEAENSLLKSPAACEKVAWARTTGDTLQ